jgi:microcystin-dependent protein
MPNIPVQNGQLPQGFCFTDFQTLLNQFSSLQFVDIANLQGIIVQASTPTAAQRTQPWLQLDSFGRPVRLYFFAQGAWLSQHPLPPGFTMIWNQVLPNFTTFDGGDANAAPFSPLSGQMWQLMAATLDGLSIAPANDVMNAKLPIGVGTLPSGAVLAATNTGGEEKHNLTLQEMFPHQHFVGSNDSTAQDGGNNNQEFVRNFNNPANNGPNALSNFQGGDPATGNPPINSLAHNTMPPYYTVYFLQRTNRLFYLVPG